MMQNLFRRWLPVWAAGCVLFSVGAAEKGTLLAELTAGNVGINGRSQVKIDSVPVTGQPFQSAIRITVTGQADQPWKLQLLSNTVGPTKLGDIGTLELYARKISGSGKFDLMMQRNGAPYTKFAMETGIALGPEWKRIKVIWAHEPSWGEHRKDAYAPGEAQIGLNLGYAPQVIEISPVRALNYGADADVSKLDAMRYSYRGREANAPWRKAAAQRIETLRKGDFSIKLTDAKGKALAGAPVKITMRRHHFSFGSSFSLGAFYQDGADRELYRKNFLEFFNMAVIENELKWGQGWEYDDRIKGGLDFLEQHHIAVRGHTLIWPGWRYLPEWLKLLKDNKTALRQVVRDHIYYEASMLKDRVAEFDVMNEFLENYDLQKILGRPVMAEWYRIARQAAPNVRLCMNEANVLNYGDLASYGPADEYYRTVRELLKAGAPVEGLGFQGHFYENRLTPPETLLKQLDRFGEFNIPLKITEYDLRTFDEQLEADYLRDVMTVMFSHPRADGFLMWGFWDGSHWRGAAPIFRKDWSLKPSGAMYRKLLTEIWSSNFTGRSDGGGVFNGRAFYGEYTLETEVAGRKISVPFRVTPGGERDIVLSIKQ